jgi:hypothetical protein
MGLVFFVLYIRFPSTGSKGSCNCSLYHGGSCKEGRFKRTPWCFPGVLGYRIEAVLIPTYPEFPHVVSAIFYLCRSYLISESGFEVAR